MLDEKIRKTLLNNFLRISAIPRESGNEQKIADFFEEVAKENNLECFRDEYNNILIKKNGKLNSEPIALQAHFDMVCVEDEGTNHDFNNSGIDVKVDGDKVMANHTSLGADQGVGLAIMLTLIEDSNNNSPDLEFIFTVEEETTFKGAVTFPYSKVKSKRMLNLDNADDASVIVGADGDICNEFSYKGLLIKNSLPSYKVIIHNFPGGNSGENVKLSENNAITTMASLLKDKSVYIRSINGGSNENDLADSCEVIINTDLSVIDIFKRVDAKIESVQNEFSFSLEDTKRIINEILELKCGFILDNDASANIGVIKTEDNEVKLCYIFRGMHDLELDMINNNCKSLKNNFKVKELYRDSIWNVNAHSELLKKYKELYFKEYKAYPKEEICHAALECSSIISRIDGLDIISIGGIIKKYHTTSEVTYISSWVKIYKLIVKLLENL